MGDLRKVTVTDESGYRWKVRDVKDIEENGLGLSLYGSDGKILAHFATGRYFGYVVGDNEEFTYESKSPIV